MVVFVIVFFFFFLFPKWMLKTCFGGRANEERDREKQEEILHIFSENYEGELQEMLCLLIES